MSKSVVIHQLVHTLSYGDAISAEVIALQRCFRSLGFESEIYAIHEHPKLKGFTRKYTELDSDFSGEVILHYSLGSPLNELYRSLTGAVRTMIYHNLTPSHWFEGINPRIVRDIQHGEQELPELCGLTNRLLADSSYNAGELEKLGFQATVLELTIDAEKWGVPRNEGIYSLVRSQPGIHVLHVGRLAPNKCVEDIIKSFYFLHHKLQKNSTLWLVGIDTDTELYSFALRRLVHELDLVDAVRFAGCLADEEVRALYEAASVYICMSEHEGFCLPVIEAMHFELPVIAYACTALPDTVGSGGILVSEKRHAEIAALIERAAVDSALRDRVVTAGKARVAELSYTVFQKRVKELFIESGTAERTAARAG